MNAKKRILITPGEPAGIGPDIVLQALQQSWPDELVVIADPDLMRKRADQLGLSVSILTADLNQAPKPHHPQTLKVLPVKLNAQVEAGKLNAKNADYVIRTLEQAAHLCSQNAAKALVTGPVHKGIINQAGMVFTGHTEFFAQFCHVKKTVMLFVLDQLKVALATTHVPLAKVASVLTKDLLQTTLILLHDELKSKFQLSSPRILVCGLNPHAGEGGYLGREEIDTITPVIDELKQKGYHLTGPLPADTIFTRENLKHADVILAMYHDQGLPLVKYIGFGHAVNVTLGLPFVRTSVDHGTALDLAGSKKSDAGSLVAAIELAIELTCNEPSSDTIAR